jgi:hypothetical protein
MTAISDDGPKREMIFLLQQTIVLLVCHLIER